MAGSIIFGTVQIYKCEGGEVANADKEAAEELYNLFGEIFEEGV
jgi:hypothetical protein